MAEIYIGMWQLAHRQLKDHSTITQRHLRLGIKWTYAQAKSQEWCVTQHEYVRRCMTPDGCNIDYHCFGSEGMCDMCSGDLSDKAESGRTIQWISFKERIELMEVDTLLMTLSWHVCFFFWSTHSCHASFEYEERMTKIIIVDIADGHTYLAHTIRPTTSYVNSIDVVQAASVV